jgi:hypothetical protein
MSYDKVIFGKKTFSDLLKEIHTNTRSTREQITSLIRELQPLIENIGDATLVVPLIKEYLDIKVKNDDILVKLASVIQRMETAQAKGDSEAFNFGAETLADLLEEVQRLEGETKQDNTLKEDV